MRTVLFVTLFVLAAFLALSFLENKHLENRKEIRDNTEGVVHYDKETGLMWQTGNSLPLKGDYATKYCDQLILGGYSDWRLPTISELRSIIRGCSSSELSGQCGVKDSCSKKDCRKWQTCSCEQYVGPGENGFYWEKDTWHYSASGKAGGFWSATPVEDAIVKGTRWRIYYNSAHIEEDLPNNDLYARCVRSTDKTEN